MIFTGFTDEAGSSLEMQIKATKALGWADLSARTIGSANIHDVPEAEFERIVARLEEEDLHVYEFGSLIGSWSKKITSDFDITLAEIDRAIPRMHRLNTKVIRVMSYAQEPWGSDQFEAERFRRLRAIVERFADAGITAMHENCMNWGGFSAAHTLRLIEEVPGLKLVFDTGNPVSQRDRSKPGSPWQDALEFFMAVKDHIGHVHIKDATMEGGESGDGAGPQPRYTWPGEGDGKVRQIVKALIESGYNGAIAIEPHVATVFHDPESGEVTDAERFLLFVEYGRRFSELYYSIAGELSE
ncbi:MAG: sugar phosphate isomerase/epimerase [Bacteroidetes bacterium]|nr:sugar phosphate isomerase/epimerase [Bacteroidota bacterium]